MDDDEKKADINNNDFLLYYTKYRPYDIVNNSNSNENNNESLELNEDENDNNNILNGRWSQKEHLLFIKGCLLYGNNWKKVKKYIQTRSCSQIRSHAQKYLNKINKKYYGNKNDVNNVDLNLKLSDDEIKRLVNKNKFSEKDMDDAELYILSIFKSNKDKDKSLLEDNDEKESDITKNNSRSCSKKIIDTESEKIFNIIKVSKEEKQKEKEKKNFSEENQKNNTNKENVENFENGEWTENFDMDIDDYDINDKNDNSGISTGNNHKSSSRNSKSKSKQRKILKENILAEKIDSNTFSQNEAFINKCLDSKDPKDLVKLLTHFGNDINFKVSDIKILKKYQEYLGLDIDNEEENNCNNVNNKEVNDTFPISDESVNNQNQTKNNIYPYMFNPNNNSFQFKPLCNPKLLVNPAFMNQY